ncbi:MAG: AbrB/MazE/SpoVT family DNA-binding domain-containing protein [Selenomonadaceae bacterium]|nr:AbrB/MazE/SpoVT family DNA-binding domain-containing protein [Selenomonadaceae bacterium]
MEKAKVVKIGDEQLVCLPKDFNLQGDEILIRRKGNVITLMTKEEAGRILEKALNGFTEDFLPNGREPQTYLTQR